MILVIDANSFIAGFLRNSTSRQIILSGDVALYSPKWLVDELERNEDELMAKFPGKAGFAETKRTLLEFVRLVPASEYSPYIKEASRLVKHPKDIPYFALALYLNCAIWSNERSFKNQPIVEVFSTSDMVKKLKL